MTYDEMVSFVITKGIYKETMDEGLKHARSQGHYPQPKVESPYVVQAPSTGYECARCGGVLVEIHNGADSIIYGGSLLYGRCYAGLVK